MSAALVELAALASRDLVGVAGPAVEQAVATLSAGTTTVATLSAGTTTVV